MHVLNREPDYIRDPIEVICGVPNWFPTSSPRLIAEEIQPRQRRPIQSASEEQREQAKKLIKAGNRTYAEIALMVGISKSAVYRVATRAGIGPGSGAHNQHSRRRAG